MFRIVVANQGDPTLTLTLTPGLILWEVHRMIAAADDNGDGNLDFCEFVHLLSGAGRAAT